MPPETTKFLPVRQSLAGLCGEAWVAAAAGARSALTGESAGTLIADAAAEIDFYPQAFQARQLSLLQRVGETVAPPLDQSAAGASTTMFNAATKPAMAPLSALGCFRVGEDGRLYLAAKSEHYHASLGHGFPGYGLIEVARRLGIPNATHNNTRGHLTRLLEERLVAAANGLDPDDRNALNAVLETNSLEVLNRVLNLETGSLAVEAALKMMLARFYRMQQELADPRYAGKTPVFLVMGDEEGNVAGNYHGTTVLTQLLRGMWPDLAEKLNHTGAFRVCAVRPNNHDDLDAAFREHQTDTSRIAGMFHEIVMMNYGGLVLTSEFLHHAYDLCQAHDVPVCCDEIQSCIWSPEIFMFREYGLKPTFVSAGKGFPGGEYPASRLVFSSAMDNGMPQFGALVTNGQEELASLAYLITLYWAQANRDVTRAVGAIYHTQLRALAGRFPDLVTQVAGSGHMSTLYIRDLDTAKAIAAHLVAAGLDVSAQTYKADCPPALLTKLPLIAGQEVVEFVVTQFEAALTAFADRPTLTATAHEER